MFRVFTMPKSDPTTTTLQASRESWEEVADFLAKRNKSGWSLLVTQALRSGGEGVIRMTFQDATAQAIKRELGLSA